MSNSSVEVERLQATVDCQSRHIAELQMQLAETLVCLCACVWCRGMWGAPQHHSS